MSSTLTTFAETAGHASALSMAATLAALVTLAYRIVVMLVALLRLLVQAMFYLIIVGTGLLILITVLR